MRLRLLASLWVLAPLAPAQDWITLEPDGLDRVAGDAPVEQLADGSLRIGGEQDVDRYRLVFPTEVAGITALRLEVLPDESLPHEGPGRADNGNFVLSDVLLATRVGRNRRVVDLAHATASFSQVGWPVLAAIDGRDDTGWAISPRFGERAEAVFNLDRPLGKGRRTLELELSFLFGQRHSIGRLRVSVTTASGQILAEGVNGGLSDLQRAVNGAIDRGVEYLLERQDLDGSWPGDRDHYRVGGTALNAYALVKSGLKPEHQAVRRALAYVDAHPPRKTYEAGCVLMLYSALPHDVYRERARNVLADLIDWQLGDWGYPGSHGNPSAGHKDLSNTQYGALGFWAASKMALEVPEVAWRRLAEAVLRYQRAGGGFGYTPNAGATGSMTSAGVAVLALCVEHLEGAIQREAQAGLERGLAWLDDNFQPDDNTGKGKSWLLYYLYGVERVGAFTERREFNSMDWYAEGARYLLKQQKDDGHWDNQGRPQANTSFALLFLGRATASVTGAGVASRNRRLYGADDPQVDISLRAAGDTPLTVWVSSFGNELLDGYTFEDERELGPRVLRVEYLTDGAVVLPDSRHGGSHWHYDTREPQAEWIQPGFESRSWDVGRSGFGPRGSAQLTVGTPWERDTIWLIRDENLHPYQLIDPRLEVCFSSAGPGLQRGPQGELLKLYDEEADFVTFVPEGRARFEQVAGGAHGQHSLVVGAVQRHAQKIPGWGFPIREEPGPGEYRYVRFRWRKTSGAGGVMVQFAFEGGWGNAQRYHAGPNSVKFEPSLEVAGRITDEWVTVTRDLWADHGDGLLTGLALTAMDGEAGFDALYLARKKSDLRGEDELLSAAPEWRPAQGGAPAGTDALVLWINGERATSLDRETLGFEALLEGDALKSRLRPGVNRFALRAQGGGEGRAVDLGIVGDRRLADVNGNADEPARDERYAARVEFPRPGEYRVWARVHVLDGVTEDAVVFESRPLTVRIDEAFDRDLLEYARDASRNLLLDGDVTITASTEHNGWPAARALDGRYDLAWLCADGDLAPQLDVKIRRPIRADRLLLSHTRVDRNDAQRSTLPTRVAVVLNGKGDPFVLEMEPDRLRKAVLVFEKPQKIRSFTVRVLDRTPGDPVKTAVGFAEVELQLRGGD